MADLQVRAISKYVPGSPVKARRVVNAIRGMGAERALQLLRLMPQAAAKTVGKTLKSAMANAEENYGLSKEDMVIKEIYANEGPRLKRARFGARGRFKPIIKRTSHITIVLEEQEAKS
jgi:large subunit ribosomal protein L22